MPDLYDKLFIEPMLIGHETEPFDSEDYIFELKLDGVRGIAFVDPKKVILRNKRNKDVTDIYPELQDIRKAVKKKCILDGEFIVLKNGKPDFSGIQKRSLMSDSFKINLAIKKFRVEFVAYDILYCDGKDLTSLPLMERKKVLDKNIKEGNGLSISRYIETYGVKFFELAKLQELEGIVAKEKTSKYFQGKRTKTWKKIKFMQDEDLIICGYVEEEGTIKDLVLGYYDTKGILHSRGKIALGISKIEQSIIKEYAKKNKVKKPWFEDMSQDIIWLKLQLVGTAHYMHLTKNGHMRQPVWKGLRDDKDAKDCIS